MYREQINHKPSKDGLLNELMEFVKNRINNITEFFSKLV
jgi:hypothetical protein